MIGGLIKSNRVAALAGAGFIASALAVSPAQAADLGGDCCADLEERVATLEATTARKGNRKVSLTVSGWVNTGLYIWDDGVDSDAYVVTDNGTTLATRITFSGSAKINSDWSAGYTITIEPQNSEALLGVTQNNDDGGAVNGVGLLESYMYVKSEQLGKLSWGLQSQATDNVGIVDLSGSIFSSIPVVFRGNAFLLRSNTGGSFDAAGNAVAGLTGAATNQNILQCHGIGTGIGNDCFGLLTNSIKYESPTISGFTLSTSWGEDDFYDVALKYAGQFGDLKVAGAFGYTNIQENNGALAGTDTEVFTLAGSIMHVPTGIFVNATYTLEDVDTLNGVAPPAGFEDSPDSIYIKAGIKQKWNSLGATAIYGEWGQYNDGYTLAMFNNGVTGSEVTRYGAAIHQWIDAASMQMYAKWNTFEYDVDGTSDLTTVGIEDFTEFTVGGVIFF
ncbi:hypothetical protein NBRC116602_27030 [Hyphomicrobiales bacterium 4NK60-0047b]